MTDKLDEIIEMQLALMNTLNVPRLQNTPFDIIQKQIPHFMFALVCELGEIGDAINWKSWKKTEKEVDMDNLRMEFIDALHFLLEMMLMCGMTAETIHYEYKKKMAENIDRQKRGY